VTSEPASGCASGLDRLLSDPTRLALMSVVCAVEWCDFAFLREQVALSDSALSKQLTTLKNDGQVEQRRTYTGRVPKTAVRATAEGRRRFRGHVEALRMIVERFPDPEPTEPAEGNGPAPSGG
jgi:DNA-binding transcriptional ArsR family regulator